MSVIETPYFRFSRAKELVRDARRLKSEGKMDEAFDKLLDAVLRVIDETDDEFEDTENRYHDLDGRIG